MVSQRHYTAIRQTMHQRSYFRVHWTTAVSKAYWKVGGASSLRPYVMTHLVPSWDAYGHDLADDVHCSL